MKYLIRARLSYVVIKTTGHAQCANHFRNPPGPSEVTIFNVLLSLIINRSDRLDRQARRAMFLYDLMAPFSRRCLTTRATKQEKSWYRRSGAPSELELELIQSYMTQKPMLLGEVDARALRV